MFRLTRPLFQQALKTSTGLTGLAVHPNPLPVLRKTLESTKELLQQIPSHSVYRQSTTTLTQRRLDILDRAQNDVEVVEKELGLGQIEEVLVQAEDEFKLVQNMLEWKAWEPLSEQAPPDQFVYFGQATSPS
ncbi:hypothetical protein Clacol_003860 [Clathrus columnatus]|uniref:Uncharacterized protein n=1 Tax=Clathrus columnatus TaxID=1419009 RepID=A0AAV5AAV7_9AGAM|nr:hypothetical protein Clacol_003860 [Clathrus columnatus]